MLNDQSKFIKEHDLVVLWLTKEQQQLLKIESDKIFQNKFGRFNTNDIINKRFGDKLVSTNNKGFIHLLKPTPELWTNALPHRTQILYNTDISFILLNLNIKPSSVVIESGTGSGSFSHAIARTIGRRGRLHSFEYHKSRSEKVSTEFEEHGLSDIITVYNRDACKLGFTDQLNDSVDAVFLDLPMPWLAIPHGKKSLRKDKVGRICCFSPCIEQVLKTVKSLNDEHFANITTYEVLTRNYDTSYNQVPTINDITTKLKHILEKKEFRRQQQISSAQAKHNKQLKINEKTEPSENDVKSEETETPQQAPKRKFEQLAPQDASTLLSRPFMDTRGHTSYLTFASLLPYDVDNESEEEAVDRSLIDI
ncbi:hypothetical protein E3Q24_01816 [Wallemia mellicola]|nr:hypothetical protein E3Q24_01816 [Wallemia mellicola]